MLGDVCAQKYSKTADRTRSILEKFAFVTTLINWFANKLIKPIQRYLVQINSIESSRFSSNQF